jgi:excisionase family DNA binding protein
VTDPLIETLVNAIAEAVAARLRPQLQSPAKIQPVLLDVKDAAEYLGRTEVAVQHLVHEKSFPVVRVGRRVHLDRRDLDAWIEKNKY